MAKRNKKVGTIEGLARLMQGEFLGVHKRMDTEFATVHKRMDTEFASVHKRMDTEFGAVHKRIDVLDAAVQEMRKNSSELFEKLDEFIAIYRDTKQEVALLARQVKRLEERILQLEVKK